MSPRRINPGLEHRNDQGGISPTTPSALAGGLHSLPPILHRPSRNSLPSCSKGARGLFVQSRVGGIFTATTISLSTWLRQRSSRYAIHAGRNLPDKGFRYLRTVQSVTFSDLCIGVARSSLPGSACHHAVRTISSLLGSGVWSLRIIKSGENLFFTISPIPTIVHIFADVKNLLNPFTGLMFPFHDESHYLLEF